VGQQAGSLRKALGPRRRPWVEQYSLQSAVSECSPQAARARGL
jgi:hypothetical protein